MRLKLGNWAGGAEGNAEGTITWAGGKTDFSQAPFDMYVKEVSIQNYNPADSYEYGDKTGSWQSIKINKDGSSSNAGGSGSGSTSSKPVSYATSQAGSSTTDSSSSASSTAEDTENQYTSTGSVLPLDQHTQAANSVTQTGSMYSTNTASASALNSAISASTMNTVVSASTQVPDSTPTGYGNATWNHNSSSSSSSGSAAAQQTTSSANRGMVAGSVVGLAFGFALFML